ncbi:MAG: TIGR04002 family protein [Eubacteriales bacterium]|jgi:uncharacterized repeat protein (TIGR04002 family)|nr:TIGR04002 family protein [Clostridiales bacterium]
MKAKSLRNIVLSAVFAAIIFVATAYLPRLPILGGAGGYVHVGDTFIYLAASVLPLPYAMVAGAIGGALADALTGYVVWAPATFIIKALMALPFHSTGTKIASPRNIIASAVSGLVCTAGYYIYEALLITSFAVAAASLPFNLIQGLISTVLFAAVGFAFDRLKLKSKIE